MKVCTVNQMRKCDKDAEEKFGINSLVLMENAARSCFEAASDFTKIAVVCGKGNNAGDGFAAARHLINSGRTVTIFTAFSEGFSEDAQINYNILRKLRADIVEIKDIDEFRRRLADFECIIDALFGTGIHGEITGNAAKIIETVNNSGAYIISADIPSGVNADTGEVCSVAVRADKTVTFAAYKTGLLMYPGADFTGEIIVSDISMPKALFEDVTVNVHGEDYFAEIMPKRFNNSQKGNYGKIFIIGGKKGMAGAVCMAASAALKTGAGIVTACIPEEINDIVQIALPQVMTFPVDFEKDTDKIIEKMKDFDVILFGNGIGRDICIENLLAAVLENADMPVIIDADGLFAFSKNIGIAHKCDFILTPHSMEMARLLKTNVEEVEKNRLSLSEKFVSDNKVTLVLKGNHTIITAASGIQSINLTGNSGMATAGSGDVLAGITAALAAVKKPEEAAELAVYLHGCAGDYAAKALSEYSVTAADIQDALPHILPLEKMKRI